MAHFLVLLMVGIVLIGVQFAAALPWVAILNDEWIQSGRRQGTLRPVGKWVGGGLLLLAVAGLLLALFLLIVQNRERLEFWGRVYGSILHVQLAIDFFLLVFGVLLRVWPKGGAVALAAFREGVRQPMFWLLVAAAVVLLVVSLFVPYFTFHASDEFKMMKLLGYDVVMLGAVAFGVIAAGMSISEEIEGRTAITLMSKPVSRRQFLLGKFTGILLTALAMTALTGWCLVWALYAKPLLDREPMTDPLQSQLQPGLAVLVQQGVPAGESAHFVQGIVLWLGEVLAVAPGLVVGFSQVMVLLAIATALATRMTLVINLVACLVLFFLGHLAPVLVQTAQNQQLRFAADHPGQTSAALDLVQFMAQLFDTLLPALDFFNMGPATIRDTPLDAGPLGWYVGSVFVLAGFYTAIALLVGLILFEDRDLA